MSGFINRMINRGGGMDSVTGDKPIIRWRYLPAQPFIDCKFNERKPKQQQKSKKQNQLLSNNNLIMGI